MFEFIYLFESITVMDFLEVQVNDVNLVVHRVDIIARYSHLKFVIFPVSKSNTVVLKVTLVSVCIFCKTIFRKSIYFIFELNLTLGVYTSSNVVSFLLFLLDSCAHLSIILYTRIFVFVHFIQLNMV